MLDSNDLLNVIKKIATESVDATKPTALTYGRVTSISPLKINVEQKMTLTSAQLVLTRNVTNFQVNMTVNHATDPHTHTHTITDTWTGGGSASDETHQHTYSGTKTFTVHNALAVGDEVVMIRMQGGQRFLVLDKVVQA